MNPADLETVRALAPTDDVVDRDEFADRDDFADEWIWAERLEREFRFQEGP